MTAPALPAWQRGFALDRLRTIRRIFDEHDRGLTLGAFTGVMERTIATWLDAADLLLDHPSDPRAAVVARTTRAASPVRDFTGAARATIPAGAIRVPRFACLPGAEDRLTLLLDELEADGPIWTDRWVEHPTDRAIAADRDWRDVAVKVRASSELVAVATSDPDVSVEPVTPADRIAIGALDLPPLDPAPLLDRLTREDPTYSDHYSSYNLRRSWSAVGLRSYGGDAAFIIKPAEMSKAWKAEHADALTWEVRDTPLRAALPEAEPLIAAIPAARVERIRLMRLAPGNGELSRHADVVDPDAGTAPGRLLRIHIPILTNPDVVFTGWELDGTARHVHMAAGRAWYLDTRKPHRAVNAGPTERIHLVIDAESSPELLALL